MKKQKQSYITRPGQGSLCFSWSWTFSEQSFDVEFGGMLEWTFKYMKTLTAPEASTSSLMCLNRAALTIQRDPLRPTPHFLK